MADIVKSKPFVEEEYHPSWFEFTLPGYIEEKTKKGAAKAGQTCRYREVQLDMKNDAKNTSKKVFNKDNVKPRKRSELKNDDTKLMMRALEMLGLLD